MKKTSILIPIILISCLLALGFLFYKAMQTMPEDEPRSSRPIVLNQEDYNNGTAEEAPTDIGESAAYDASANDGFRELTPAEREEARRQSRLEEEREAAAEKEAREREARLDAEAAAAAREERERKSREARSTDNPSGQYLVIAGSFRQKSNAEQRVTRLRNAGFTDTRLEKFNRGTFAVALAGQTDRFSAAERLAQRIVGAGFEAKVMRKR